MRSILVIGLMITVTLSSRADEVDLCAPAGPRRGAMADLQDFGCKVEQLSSDCLSFFYEHPDLLMFARNCDTDQPPNAARPNWALECLNAGIDSWTDIWKQLSQAGRAIDACNEKLSCKGEIARQAYFACKNSDGKLLYPCTESNELESVDIRDLLRKRDKVRELAKRDKAYRQELERNGLSLIDNSEPSFEAVISASLNELNVRYQCFNTKGRIYMGCYALGMVVDPTLVVGGSSLAALKGSRWISTVLKSVRSAKVISSSRTSAILELEQKWGRSLSAEELASIEHAHRIGVGEVGRDGGPAIVDNYTWSQLRKKNQTLKKQFSKNEIRDLMQAKIVGSTANDVANERVLSAFQRIESQTADIANQSDRYRKSFAHFKDYQAFKKQIDDLTKRQNDLFSQWKIDDPASTGKIERELKWVEDKLTDLRDNASMWETRSNNTNWNVVRQQPRAIVPNRKYTIQSDRNEVIMTIPPKT